MHVCLRAVWHAPLALGSITPFTSGLTPNALSRPKDGDVLAVLACAATTRYLHINVCHLAPWCTNWSKKNN